MNGAIALSRRPTAGDAPERISDPKPRETEEAFLQSIREVFRAYNWKTYHTRNSLRSDKGFPDLVAVRPPRLVFAELKVEPRKPTAEQNLWMQLLAMCPQVEVYLWYPRDWPEIVACARKWEGS